MANLTPHIEALPGDFGKTVLMPGDPRRAEMVVRNFFENPRLVNDVRGVHGYTGTYKGVTVSVMASGMGMPSIGIYSHELFNVFGVENIMRVGSAGALQPDIRVRDILFGMGACTDSNFAHQFNLPGTFAPICSYELLSAAVEESKKLGLEEICHVGNLMSSDCFYHDPEGVDPALRSPRVWQKMGVLGLEMEAAALYMEAARAGKNALAICTVSDHLLTGESTTSAERQETFTHMIELALNIAVAVD